MKEFPNFNASQDAEALYTAMKGFGAYILLPARYGPSPMSVESPGVLTLVALEQALCEHPANSRWGCTAGCERNGGVTLDALVVPFLKARGSIRGRRP